MLKTLFSAAVLVAALAVAAATNPSPEQHRARIKSAIAERSPLAGALGLGSLAAFTSAYHSLGVVSYTVVQDRTVSVGVFGMVFIVE
jgi:hypothetical protein